MLLPLNVKLLEIAIKVIYFQGQTHFHSWKHNSSIYKMHLNATHNIKRASLKLVLNKDLRERTLVSKGRV